MDKDRTLRSLGAENRCREPYRPAMRVGMSVLTWRFSVSPYFQPHCRKPSRRSNHMAARNLINAAVRVTAPNQAFCSKDRAEVQESLRL